MKFFSTLLFAGLIAGLTLAETPADPKPPDPKDPKAGDPNDPNKPPDKPPIVSTTEWAPNWQAARNLATQRSGYALMWVTMDKKDGKDAPHTMRLNDLFFGNARVFRDLNEQFGCWKGTMAEARTQGGKHLDEAGVKEAPALIIVDPDDGAVVEQYNGRFTYLEATEVVKAVMDGNNRKKLQEKLEDKEKKNDPKLNLLYGNACFRAGDVKEARKHFEIGMTSTDRKDKAFSTVGTVWCDLKEKKYKEAIDGAQKLFDDLPMEAQEPKGTCLYIQLYSYYEQNELEEASKLATKLRAEYVRTTYGWKMIDDMADLGFDFIKKEKIVPGAPNNNGGGGNPEEQPK